GVQVQRRNSRKRVRLCDLDCLLRDLLSLRRIVAAMCLVDGSGGLLASFLQRQPGWQGELARYAVDAEANGPRLMTGWLNDQMQPIMPAVADLAARRSRLGVFNR